MNAGSLAGIETQRCFPAVRETNRQAVLRRLDGLGGENGGANRRRRSLLKWQ
jgi:hypothetical protein